MPLIPILEILAALFTLPHGHGIIAAVPFDLAPRRTPGVERLRRVSFPVASGIIAGGSLMAVILIFWQNGPEYFRQLLRK